MARGTIAPCSDFRDGAADSAVARRRGTAYSKTHFTPPIRPQAPTHASDSHSTARPKSVTGSKYLLEAEKARVLIDCGFSRASSRCE